MRATATHPIQPFPPLCCSDPCDRLAFALHAFVLSNGYRLVGVGDAAKLEGGGAP